MHTIQSVNNAVLTSLSVFLVAFVAYLAFSEVLYRRNARAKAKLREAAPVVWGPRDVKVNTPRSYKKQWNSVPVRVRGALWAMTFSAVVFGYLCFAPATQYKTAYLPSEPVLRLTWLDYHRATHGFRLEGHVWNQSKTTLRNVQTTVLALNPEGKAIGQANGLIVPGNLEPGQSGKFSISCDRMWRDEASHALRFSSDRNVSLEYVEQFPPTRILISVPSK